MKMIIREPYIFEKCDECEYMTSHYFAGEYRHVPFCGHKDRERKLPFDWLDDMIPPDWCPLPDAPAAQPYSQGESA